VRRGWVDRGGEFYDRGARGTEDGDGKGGERKRESERERDGAGRGGACALHLINLNPN